MRHVRFTPAQRSTHVVRGMVEDEAATAVIVEPMGIPSVEAAATAPPEVTGLLQSFACVCVQRVP